MDFLNFFFLLLKYLLLFAMFYLAGSFFNPILKSFGRIFRGACFVGLGYFLIGSLLLGLGVLKMLSPSVVFVMCSLVCVSRICFFPDLVGWAGDVWDLLWGEKKSLSVRVLQVFFLVQILFTAMLCGLPEVAHDSLVYHMNLPKLYVQAGTISTYYYDLMSYRPLFLQVLYTLAFLFNDPGLAKLIHWTTGILMSVVLMDMCQTSGASYRFSLFAGLMLLLTPTVINEIQTTYTSVGGAFFVLLSLGVMIQAEKSRYWGAYLASGMMMGLALGSKLIFIIAIPGFLFLYAWGFWKPDEENSRSASRKALVAFLLGIAITFGFWVVRNFAVTGNPFYPYFSKFFGLPDYNFEGVFIRMGVSKTLLNFITLPITLTFHPFSFDWHHWIGPLYLVLFPFAIYGALKHLAARKAMVISAVFVGLWFYVGQFYRFLIPVLPLLLFAGAIGYRRARERFVRWGGLFLLTKMVAVASMVCLAGLGLYHFRDHARAIVFNWSPKKYLQHMERTTDVADWVNTHLPSNAKILSLGEIRAYYFDRPLINVAIYRFRHPETEGTRPLAMVTQFREEGITHLLLVEPVERTEKGGQGSLDETGWDGLISALKSGKIQATKEFEARSRNRREDQYRYTLYRI